MNYQAPDVYVENVKSGSQSISQVSSSVGAVVGVTRSGLVNVAQLVTSWSDFISKYANGLDTPFVANSYLPYAVYGFFANGGKQLYVSRVASKTAKKATKVGTVVTVEALSEGTWGNDVSVEIVKNADWTEENALFDVIVSVGTNDSTTVREVTLSTIEDAVMTDAKAKNWLSKLTLNVEDALVAEKITLAGGTDGVEDLVDSDYVAGLSNFDPVIDEITMVAVPGEETDTVRNAVLTYCDNNKIFPIVSMPKGSTVAEAKTYRKSISAEYGAMPYPWGNMTDPLTNREKAVPPEGHYMGVCARILTERGVHKAPAGTEATLRGFNSMEIALSKADCEILNPVGVVCLLSRRNFGLVVWGARGLNSADTTMRYVSDHFLNINIRKSLYEGTQFAVFEPNDPTLWKRVYTSCKNFLETLRMKGAFKGAGEGTAWYVTVDETNNTDATINEGILNIEVGYAPVKPAEFVVIKLAHSIESAE